MVRAGEAAELLCAGLRVAAEVRAVSAGRVLAALHPPGTSAIRKAIMSPVTGSRHKGNGHAANINTMTAAETEQ